MSRAPPPALTLSSGIGGAALSRQASEDSASSLLNKPRYGPSANAVPLGYASGRSSPSPSPSFSEGLTPRAYQTASVNSKGGYVPTATGGSWAAEKAGADGPPSPASGGGGLAPNMNDKFSLSPNPALWGADVSAGHAEADDYLHNPDPKRDRKYDSGGSIFTLRGLINLGCIFILIAGLITVFAGWPIIVAVKEKQASTFGAFNLGGINSTGQVAQIISNRGLIDVDTPESAMYHTSFETGEQWELVFSDEFDTPGRTFWPGDDPYFEAENIHYWVTNNLEWYNPVNLVTEGGYLKLTLAERPDHDLNYSGGFMTSWNKFCFRGGYVEAAVTLPGSGQAYGLWPAIWSMGNLGRAGYGGTTEGMWPYTYNSCDVGTLHNQTLNGKPEISTTSGPEWAPYNGSLSYLNGQRLSRCTCPNDATHPGPMNSDGSYMGRSAPELDMFEAQVNHETRMGDVSQSLQYAPFNPEYTYINTSDVFIVYDEDTTVPNSYVGGVYQSTVSGLTITNQNCYQYGGTKCFAVYGYEYAPGDDGYITWVNDGKKSWTARAGVLGANAQTQVSDRPIPYEPMYLIFQSGISLNFGDIDWVGLAPQWPMEMRVDYIRVYQDPKNKMIGCDPEDMPTASYIETYIDAYTNANLTTWDDVLEHMPNAPGSPKNRLVDTC